jgi:hypothetical protein
MKAIAKHFPESEETMKGHGQKSRSGLQSTRPKQPISNANAEPNNNADLTIPIAKEHNILIKVNLVEEEGNNTVCTNQPGHFPKKMINSLTPKSVPAGAKKILFGRYVLNIYGGIVRYFLRKTKTRRAKIYLPTQRTIWRISYDIN